MKKKILTPILLLSTTLSFASVNEIQIVYGEDNRVETFQSSLRNQKLANSTAGMIESVKLVKSGKFTILPPASIKTDMGLCEDERFSDQPSSVICSGFLVGPDLLVTAGHCVTNQARCEEVSFIFDYKIKAKTNRADMMIPNTSIYKCAKVIDAKLEGSGPMSRDFALIKLDRVVEGKEPLKYRTAGKIKTSENILVIGHPSGLPQKVAPGAQVFNNSSAHFFETNLDTFGGNSGSAVFNDTTGEIEGILVRGAKDYVQDSENSCLRVNHEVENIAGRGDLGESVSRITDIPALKYRSQFLAAAKAGDITTVKSLAAIMGTVDITDNDMNTALHMASGQNNVEVVKFLISQKVDLNAQNLRGETPLHVAAFHNMKANISQLVFAGADVLIQDEFGVYPSERTNYLAFKVRSMLRKTQKAEKAKRRND